MHIAMLAAENDLLPGGKVGGIGDVMRDVPAALAASGHKVTVLMPSYGVFHTLPSATKITLLPVPFAGETESVEVYSLFEGKYQGVAIRILEHPLFSICGTGQIYCNDPSDAPFASDAEKFALFCRAGAELLSSALVPDIDAIHLHDWHTALVAVLREYDDRYATLKNKRLVYSVHNLAIQGIRPIAGNVSSLQSWYPDVQIDETAVADPRWPTCINPMAAAIRLSDAVHTVSPSYAEEVLKPSDVAETGFYGGEGLHQDLQIANSQSRLHGILNGCDYDVPKVAPLSWNELVQLMGSSIQTWIAGSEFLLASDYLADGRVREWQNLSPPKHLITSIGRLTEQKARLFAYTDDKGESTLDRVLQTLGKRGVFILIGSGDPDYERFFSRATIRHPNFLFLNHYADQVANQLYASGDLFLMPSSFEPCGISQMLAMRAGQPCLVHAVGGLGDTVNDMSDGFSFSGNSVKTQCDAFVEKFATALKLREQDSRQWQSICQNAAQARFLWQHSVEDYVGRLYQSAAD